MTATELWDAGTRALRPRPPTRPSRHARPGDGLLPLQQRRHRRGEAAASRAASASPSSTGTCTTATARRPPSTTSRRVLFCSLHQWPLYPGSGFFNECGEGDGEGFTVNVPLPAGSGDGDYLRAFERGGRAHRRAVRAAGDARLGGHGRPRDDPLGGMLVTEAGFAAHGAAPAAPGAAALRRAPRLRARGRLRPARPRRAASRRSCAPCSTRRRRTRRRERAARGAGHPARRARRSARTGGCSGRAGPGRRAGMARRPVSSRPPPQYSARRPSPCPGTCGTRRRCRRARSATPMSAMMSITLSVRLARRRVRHGQARRPAACRAPGRCRGKLPTAAMPGQRDDDRPPSPRKALRSPPGRAAARRCRRAPTARTARKSQPSGRPNTLSEARETVAMVAAEVATASSDAAREERRPPADGALVQRALRT